MELFLLFIGGSLLLLGWIFFFRTGLIFRFNKWVRENIFSDQVVLFSKRRMAILLFVLGGIALFSGIDGLVDEPTIPPKIAAEMIETAKEDFQSKKYERVVEVCKSLVRSNQKDIEAWKLLAASWWTMGEKDQAGKALDTILQLDPKINLKQEPILNLIHTDKPKEK